MNEFVHHSRRPHEENIIGDMTKRSAAVGEDEI